MMKNAKNMSLFLLSVLLMLAMAGTAPAFAQENQPATPTPQPLMISTTYPSQVIGFGETVSLSMKLRASASQLVSLEVKGLPEGWMATFRGGGKIIDAVYLDGTSDVSIDLRLEPPTNLQAGKYVMTVAAIGKSERADMPLTFTVKEKLPPRLGMTVEGQPTQRGTPSTTFRFNISLKNEGGEDLTVLLNADQPKDMLVAFESAGQEVTELQLAANESSSLTVKADPLITLPAGEYPFAVRANAGELQAALELTAEVVGEGELSITTPDGRLSGEAIAGQETPLKISLTNDGSAPLRGVELTSSEPSGWSVTFDQAQIAEIPAGQKVEVTARIKPTDKAVAGDYVVSINARPVEGRLESAEFRITVRTSTLWGIVGIALIAIAVIAVGSAVQRFGRR